jgi:hypothetical protein
VIECSGATPLHSQYFREHDDRPRKFARCLLRQVIDIDCSDKRFALHNILYLTFHFW